MNESQPERKTARVARWRFEAGQIGLANCVGAHRQEKLSAKRTNCPFGENLGSLNDESLYCSKTKLRKARRELREQSITTRGSLPMREQHSSVRLLKTFGAQIYNQIVTVAVQLALLPLLLPCWGPKQYGDWLLLSAIGVERPTRPVVAR